MKRILGVAAVLATLATAAASMPAGAAGTCTAPDTCIGPPCPFLIQFDENCYAYETSYSTATFISSPGSQLTVVGLITQFGPALGFLNPNDPNKEYTFVLSGLVSKGTKTTINGPTTLYDTDYDSTKVGAFAVYEGTPRNSPDTFAEWNSNPFGGALVPASHQDGTVILSGDLCGFHTNISRTALGPSINQSGSFRAYYTPTGGTLYPFIQGTPAVLVRYGEGPVSWITINGQTYNRGGVAYSVIADVVQSVQ